MNLTSENKIFTQYKEFLKYFERYFMIDKTDDESKRGFVNAFPIRLWNFSHYTKSIKQNALINSNAERFTQLQKEHFSIKDRDLEVFITALQEWETSQKELYENESKNYNYNQRDVLPDNINCKRWEKRIGIETSYWFRFLIYRKEAITSFSNPDYLFYISCDDLTDSDVEEGTDFLPIKIDSQIDQSNTLKSKTSLASKTSTITSKWNAQSVNKFAESYRNKRKEFASFKPQIKRTQYNNLRDLSKKPIEVNDTQNSIIEMPAPTIKTSKATEIYTIETQEDRDYEIPKSHKTIQNTEIVKSNARPIKDNYNKSDSEMEKEIDSTPEKSYVKDELLIEAQNQWNKESQPKPKSNEPPMKRVRKILKSYDIEEFYHELVEADINDSNIMRITLRDLTDLGCPSTPAKEIYEELHSTVRKPSIPPEERTITNTQESITQTLDSYQYDSKKDNLKTKRRESVFKKKMKDSGDSSKIHKINTPLNKLIGQYKLKKERFLDKVGIRRFKRRRDAKEVRKIIAEDKTNICIDEQQRKQFLNQAEKNLQKELNKK